ncbi:MAG TPA: FG-GAP-like repeat-containing protein [Puia sp.]|nr:FG-GAP-like repeat-containing protein [Puia sp.]
MKKIILLICIAAGVLNPGFSHAQKNAGIFYSTLFAKTEVYSRIAGHGAGATQYFLKDVNGDGKDDAVCYFGSNGDWYVALSDGIHFTNAQKYLGYSSAGGYSVLMGDVNGDHKQDAVYFSPSDGAWYVALSTGTAFSTPVQWTIGNGVGSVDRWLADVDGDGKDDAIIYFHTGLPGDWYVGLSSGTGFGGFSPWITGFGNSSDQRMMGDVDGDGKVDALNYTKSSGNWNVALSGGSSFTSSGTWKSGFGVGKELGFAYDVDLDGKADIVYYDNGEWWTSYSTGSAFGSYDHRWVINNRPANAKGNVPAPSGKLMGNMSGSLAVACVVSNAEWLCLGNSNKSATEDAIVADTWTTWGNDYQPQVPGHTGTYDSGDSTINDIQLKEMHDAGFTYIMFDITNGVNAWVDDRAKQFIHRITYWNQHLTAGEHKMYYCISMGGSRGAPTTDAAVTIIESESQRTWTEFYSIDSASYYNLNGKPLLIHFVEWPANSNAVINYTGSVPHPYYDKFTIRWMYNAIYDSAAYSNAYGWPIYNMFGNPAGTEVMDVNPGFWNGGTGSPRNQGFLYRSQWERVLQYNPPSVWLNSFNESWEHTAVEPSYIPRTNTMDNASMDSMWTDYYNDRMDDFYWVMTRQYLRLYMYNQLYLNSYVQENGSADVYKVTACSFVYQGSMPHMAPVLLVPSGFKSSFNGTVIDASLSTVCSGTLTVTAAPNGSGNAGAPGLLSDSAEAKPLIKAAPNPTDNSFTLITGGRTTQPMLLIVTDASGRIIEKRTGISANGAFQIGQTYRPGVYFAEVRQGGDRQTITLTKK